jgi:genome maintenance exonuclease 1
MYHLREGVSYPSITTVLGSAPKPYLIKWRARVGDKEADRISSNAAKRGTALHECVEDYLLNRMATRTQSHVTRELFAQVKPKLDDALGPIFAIEKALYSDHLKVAGRVDLIAYWNGIISIVDLKTSTRVKTKADIKDYLLQVTAYALMYTERTGIEVPQGVIVIANDELPHATVFTVQIKDHVVELQQRIAEHYSRKEHANV